MKNKQLGFILVLSGALIILVQNEYSWIISSIMIGAGSGLFFWKD
jgi:hypothetical protein